MDVYEREKVLNNIKTEIPNFKEQELIEYTKNAIPNVHRFLSQEREEKLNKYCSIELIKKMQSNPEIYRISKNIDNVRVGFAGIEGYDYSEGKIKIRIDTSIFFYDDVDNNINNQESFDKYWNDIWIITYELNDIKENINKCPSCGASMEYINSKNMFTCNYCRNSIYYSQINWKIIDVEVKK